MYIFFFAVDDGTGSLEVKLKLIYPRDQRETLRLVFEEFKGIVIDQLTVKSEGVVDKTNVSYCLGLLTEAEGIVKQFTKVMVDYFYSRLRHNERARHPTLKQLYVHGFVNWFWHCKRLYVEILQLSKLLSKEKARLEKLQVPHPARKISHCFIFKNSKCS